MDIIELTVESDESGQRIDKYIHEQQPELSRTQIQQMIKDELIMVNQVSVKPNYKVSNNDHIVVTVEDPEPLDVKAEDLSLDIIYEDQDVLVVNKPRGMVVHPAPGHLDGTLVNGLLFQCKDLSGINGVVRPGIVHRIDMDTSGLLMVAKNDHAHRSLVEQLKAKTTEREYLAIVHGEVKHNQGTVDAPIGRDERNRQKMAVTRKNSKDAVTHFDVEERFYQYTFIKCRLETGRTHQIRVHMAYIGHPVAGDPKYGPKKTLPIKGQALHASTLGFEHPTTGKWLTFSVPMPDEMATLLEQLKTVRNEIEEEEQQK